MLLIDLLCMYVEAFPVINTVISRLLVYVIGSCYLEVCIVL